MKILVLAENYPHPSHPETQAFIHSRNLIYKKQGLDFSVLTFRESTPYKIDGINVDTSASLMTNERIKLCIAHAPNLRNHIRFILHNRERIQKILFVFHGYEALLTGMRSSAPQSIFSKRFLKWSANFIYDYLKLPLLKLAIRFLKKHLPVYSIFVSDSLKSEILKDMSVDEDFFKPFSIINNPINPVFNESKYRYLGSNDILCLRPFDDKKYGADLFVELARRNPQRNFHLYGKGSSFDGIKLPHNLQIFKKFFKAQEITELLNQYKAAVLFTRWDSQGILAIEFAAHGIPLIASDLPICKEMLGDYPNVAFVPNSLDFELEKVLAQIHPASKKVVKFTPEETVFQEIDLIGKLLQS